MVNESIAAHIRVKGQVQGVGYRFFVEAAAARNHLKGWVRNLPGGDVECEVEGLRPAIDQFLEDLRHGPPLSHVEAVDVDWQELTGHYKEFQII